MHMLRFFSSVFGEFQAPPIGLEYEQRVVSFTMDSKYSWNDIKEDGGQIVLVGLNMALKTAAPNFTKVLHYSSFFNLLFTRCTLILLYFVYISFNIVGIL